MASAPGARSIFLANSGPGPWFCFFCDELVYLEEVDSKLKLNVHHEDENQKNNKPENLHASHQTCHSKHHYVARREAIAAANSDRVWTPEARERISNKLTGIKRSKETVEKIRRARIDYWSQPRTG